MFRKVGPAPQQSQETLKLQEDFNRAIKDEKKDENHKLAFANIFLEKNNHLIDEIRKFRNKEGKTHLHAAAKYCESLVGVLLEAGYDYTVKDEQNRTAFETAIQYRKVHAIKSFLEVGLKNDDSQFMQQFLREKPELLGSLLELIPSLSEGEIAILLRKQIITELRELKDSLNPNQIKSIYEAIKDCNKAFEFAKSQESEQDQKEAASTGASSSHGKAASSRFQEEDDDLSLIPSATFKPLNSAIEKLEENLNRPNVVFKSPSSLRSERVSDLLGW